MIFHELSLPCTYVIHICSKYITLYILLAIYTHVYATQNAVNVTCPLCDENEVCNCDTGFVCECDYGYTRDADGYCVGKSSTTTILTSYPGSTSLCACITFELSS